MIFQIYAGLLVSVLLVGLGMNIRDGKGGLSVAILTLYVPIFGRVFGWW